MVFSPIAISLMVLSIFAMTWIALRERAARLDGNLPYHVGSFQQDRRKGRFYFLSVWFGLIVAFLAFAVLTLVATSLLIVSNTRNILLGISYGAGLGALLIIALVWSQIGQRTLEFNSDGKSLIPIPQEREQNKDQKDKEPKGKSGNRNR